MQTFERDRVEVVSMKISPMNHHPSMPLLRMSIFYLVLIGAGISAYPTPPPVCTTRCGKGEYCFGDDCKTCPDGTYQNKEDHTNISCEIWTDKPPQEHWIIIKNGTATTDQEWACANGYEEHQYSVTGVECKLISTQSPPTVLVTTKSALSTTPPSPSSAETTTSTDSTQETTAGLDGGAIAGIVMAVVFLFIAISFITGIIILRRKKKLCFSRYNPVSQNGMTPSESNDTTMTSLNEITGEANNLLSQPEEARPQECLPDGIDSQFFLDTVKKLGADDAYKLLHYLPDFSNRVDNILENEQRNSFNPEDYAGVFLAWAKENPDVNHKLELCKALKWSDLLHRIPSLQSDSVANGGEPPSEGAIHSSAVQA